MNTLVKPNCHFRSQSRKTTNNIKKNRFEFQPWQSLVKENKKKKKNERKEKEKTTF